MSTDAAPYKKTPHLEAVFGYDEAELPGRVIGFSEDGVWLNLILRRIAGNCAGCGRKLKKGMRCFRRANEQVYCRHCGPDEKRFVLTPYGKHRRAGLRGIARRAGSAG